MIKLLVFWIATFLPVLCHADGLGMGFIEGVSEDGAKKVYLYTDMRIGAGAGISYQYAVEGEARCCGRLSGRDLKFIGESKKVFKDDGGHGLVYQVIKNKIDYQKVDDFVGMVVINAKSVVGKSPNMLTGFVHKKKVMFERCFGTEGVNIYKKQGEKKLGHIYFYLGYDMDPDCS